MSQGKLSKDVPMNSEVFGFMRVEVEHETVIYSYATEPEEIRTRNIS